MRIKGVSTPAWQKYLKWLILVVLIIALFATSQYWIASLLTNSSLVRLMKAPACDPEWFVCQAIPNAYPLIVWDGNRANLATIQDQLQQAHEFNPEAGSILLRLAEVSFSLEDRANASRLMAAAVKPDSSQSPLLQLSRYEAQLIQGYQAYFREEWEEAVYHFRLGLAWGDERVIHQDQSDYFRSLAGLFQSQASSDWLDEYWSGRLLAEAGDWEEAGNWLSGMPEGSSLPADQQALRLETLGRIAEQNSDSDEAIDFYQQAVEVDPGLRSAGLRLLRLLRQMGRLEEANVIEQNLIKAGPSFYLGEQGEEYLVQEPVTLPGGWTLEGYDLDEEMLEQAHFLDLWLWWKHEGADPEGEDWIQVGERWVQRQRVTNLFPNAGFEWGVDEKEVPIGHERELYDAPAGSLFLTRFDLNGKSTNVLVTNNTEEINQVALSSYFVPMDDNLYLMRGWIWDQKGKATIGRNCVKGDLINGGQYYWFGYDYQRPLKDWVVHSQLSYPFPGFSPDYCSALMMNDADSDKAAYWENILWARVNTPHP